MANAAAIVPAGKSSSGRLGPPGPVRRARWTVDTENEEGPFSTEFHDNESAFEDGEPIAHEGNCLITTVDNNAEDDEEDDGEGDGSPVSETEESDMGAITS